MKKLTLLLLIALLSIYHSYGQKTIKYYLATKSQQNADGSVEKPYSDIRKIQQLIRSRKDKRDNVQVIIRKGIYEFDTPLSFGPDDAGDSLTSVEYMAYPGESVTFSGGKQLKGRWVKTATKNVWKLQIPGFTKGDIFRSLFVNDKRLQRATSDTLFTKGPIPQFASAFKAWEWPAIRRMVKDSIDVFCGFAYEGNALDSAKNLLSAEVILYNSWEASWLTVRNIDQKNQVLYFKNPSMFPVGFYSPRVRFRIENSRDFLDKPGEWLLDYKTGEVLYYSHEAENPNQLRFTAPVLDTLLIAKGDAKNNVFVNNLKFSNINFKYTTSRWGFNNVEEKNKVTNLKKFNWLDFSEGFSSGQASMECGAAILLERTKNSKFENCSFKHLGNYAIWISEYSTKNSIISSSINDIGGGGILIGVNISGARRMISPASKSPSFNQVLNCNISDCGLFFVSGVGIGIMQANHNIIKSNEIYNLPYTGISVGWTYTFEDSYTTHNLVENNYIHDVMRTLSDGGGIYTLGKQTGSVYRNNYIRAVPRPKNAIGSWNNGFFFDEGSSDFLVVGNVVSNIKNEDYRFHKSDSTKIQMKDNHFDKVRVNPELKKRISEKWERQPKGK
jgi:hypothetical protein